MSVHGRKGPITRAVIAERPGGVDVLSVRELPDPAVEPDQVLIRVQAAGVCGHDVLNRRGAFPRTAFPAVLGHEVAGVVIAVGGDVDGVEVGADVLTVQNQPCGRCPDCKGGEESRCRLGRGFLGESSPGGYAEAVAVSGTAVVSLERPLDPRMGSVLACALGTGLHALRRGRVSAGETVLVTGASGGVGLHSVQLAAHLGCRVIALTSTASKASQIAEAGAESVVVTSDKAAAEVKALTDGSGVDVVIDTVGSPTWRLVARTVRPGGRVVTVGNVDGASIELQPGLLILKELQIIAAAGCTRAELREVVDLVERGAVQPVIDGVLPMEAAAEAHGRLERAQVVGRLVLENVT